MDQTFWNHALNLKNHGQLPNPDGYAHAKGSCGDSLELFICVARDRIVDVTFQPHGCLHTQACGSALTGMAQGLTLDEALDLSADQLEQALGGLPREHRHCAVLAVSALKTAISDYFAKARAPWKKIYGR